MTSNTFYTLAVFAIVLLIITKPIGLWLTPIAQGRAPAVVDAIDRRLISVLAPSGREESWQRYAVSLLTFNTLGLIFLYVLQRIQGWLPLNPQGFEGVAPDQAFNTAVSFVTNTNWQSYGGEMTMSYLTQMLGMGGYKISCPPPPALLLPSRSCAAFHDMSPQRSAALPMT